MKRNNTYRSVSLALLVVLAAAVGTVAITGTVVAQDAGSNETDGNATDESFYGPSEEDPLNVRFRDCCGNTVESVAEGVLNLNLVYGMFDGPYDVEITASGLSAEQVEDITFDNAADDPNDLDRTDIVGMDFSGVPAGEYVFTVSVAGEDATATVPLEVTGEGDAPEESMTNESAVNETTTEEPTANETTSNETELGTVTAENETAENATEMGNATTGNTSVTAMPATANTTANFTVTATVGEESAGNLSAVAVNYSEANVSIATGPSDITAANVSGENVTGNLSAPIIGAGGNTVILTFDETITVEEGDTVSVTYGGITNPSEAGTYNVSVDVNPENGSDAQPATLSIGGNASAGNETEMGAAQMGNATTGNASIVATPDTANATANYTVAVPVDEGSAGNLSAVAVNYSEANVSIATGPSDITAANVSGENVTGNLSAPIIGAGGNTVILTFDETITVEEGDIVTVTYGGITNPPEAGNYTVGLDVNPENGSGPVNATLSISENTSAGEAAQTTQTTGTQTTSGQETTTDGTGAATAAETAAGTGGGGGGGGQQGTEAGGPGFGIAVAVVALLAAALLATRRN